MKLILGSADNPQVDGNVGVPDNFRSLCKINKNRVGQTPVNADGVENPKQKVMSVEKNTMVVAERHQNDFAFIKLSKDHGQTILTIGIEALAALIKDVADDSAVG